MPIQKFRTVEEMNRAAVIPPAGNPVDRFFRHCARHWKLARRSYPRGVFRFRTIEDAQAARLRADADDKTGPGESGRGR